MQYDGLSLSRAVVETLRIVAGEHSLKNDSGLEQNRLVTRVATHPRYSSSTYEDDISLIFVRYNQQSFLFNKLLEIS